VVAAGSADEPADTEAAFVPSEHDIVVGLIGPVTITDADGNPGSFERSKTIELIAWLATHREHSTRMAARTALWELDVRDATFANVVSEARRGLGRLVPPVDDEEWLARTLNEQLPLHAGVVTDADLIRERVDAATAEPPGRAIETLRPAVELVRDAPFAGTSYLWPDAEGLTSNLVLLAIGVCTELAAHALSTDDIELVFWATSRGLKVLPGHEELIGLRMKAHARAGDPSGVRCEWEAYERVIVADAWSDGEPAPKLLALRRELLDARR
jgi:two-component SAPR family response regulator